MVLKARRVKVATNSVSGEKLLLGWCLPAVSVQGERDKFLKLVFSNPFLFFSIGELNLGPHTG